MDASQHAFIGINSFMFVLIVLVCLLIGGILKKYKVKALPESGAAMILGFILGCFILLIGSKEKELAQFHPDLFFFVLLPPIIFDAGYTLKKKDFFRNLGSIISLAVPGTILSALSFGYLLYGLANIPFITPLIPLDHTSPLPFLLFGSLLSATDPVAVLALMGDKEIAADPLLYSLVFGESVLNDAIAIVLYKTFESFVDASTENTSTDNNGSTGSNNSTSTELPHFGGKDVGKALGIFTGVSLGSLVMGIAIALLCCYIFKRVDFTDHPTHELTLIFLFAYSSYFLAEICELSGIMSLFFCAVCLAHYNLYNISSHARISSKDSWKSLAQISETFVFAYIGITAGLSISSETLKWSPMLIFLTLLCCFLSRAVNIYTVSNLLNFGRRIKISFRMQTAMWWAGLRGAVAFSLALSYPGTAQGAVVTSTLIVVIFTTIVGGGMTHYVLTRLGMSGSDVTSQMELELLPMSDGRSNGDAPVSSSSSPHGARAPRETGRFRRAVAAWKRFDRVYMRHWFGDKHAAEAREERERLAASEGVQHREPWMDEQDGFTAVHQSIPDSILEDRDDEKHGYQTPTIRTTIDVQPIQQKQWGHGNNNNNGINGTSTTSTSATSPNVDTTLVDVSDIPAPRRQMSRETTRDREEHNHFDPSPLLSQPSPHSSVQ